MRDFNNVKNHDEFWVWVLLLLAIVTRLWNLQGLPLGINQDEAFAGYEAFNLLNTGKDSWLYPFPMYLTAWGSGMNALYSYLTIPFIALLGMDVWVIRLPQALLGVLSCYLFYRLLALMYGKKIGIIGFFIITICPWHIMLSRWGLESNVVVFFLLAGFYFFIRGIKDSRYLFVSALFYGLGLYAYAVCVPFIVAVFGGQLLYLGLYRRWQNLRAILGAGAFFAVMAMPILLLVLVNHGIIDEIRTAYFSIPKLVYWRGSEIGFDQFRLKTEALRRILIAGDDRLITNRLMPFGMFYPVSIVLIVIGIGLLLYRGADEKEHRQLMISGCVMVQIVGGLAYASMLYPCINRLDFLWLNFLIALAVCVAAMPQSIKRMTILVYGAAFVWFAHDYVVHYDFKAERAFTPDIKDALKVAETYHQRTGLPVRILEQPAIFSKVLYYTRMSNESLQREVTWWNYPASYLEAKSFGHYEFQPKWDYVRIPTDAVYIAPIERKYYFYQFEVNDFGAMIVALPQDVVARSYE